MAGTVLAGEEIDNEVLPLDQALALIDSGEIDDAKTIAAILFYERRRGSTQSVACSVTSPKCKRRRFANEFVHSVSAKAVVEMSDKLKKVLAQP